MRPSRHTMRRSVFANALIALLTVGVVLGAFVSFQRKRSSFERIDFTLIRQNGVIVVKTVDPGTGAAQAGLRPGDAILVIAGTPTAEVEGVQKTLRRIGEAVLMALWAIDLLIFDNAVAIATPRTTLLILQKIELANFGLYFTLAVVALAFTYRRAAEVGKKQIKWIYLGLALGFLPFLLIYII